MRRKWTYGLIILTVCSLQVRAQQMPQYTQYMFNDFAINPAIAGIYDYYQIRSNHRFQWVGISDPPLTNTISVYGPHASMPMGFGGTIYNDITGPTSRTGISGAYGYNISIDGDMRLSFGLSLGLMQYKVDGTQITLKEENDIALQDAVYSTYVPDASVGVYLYAENYYAGFATTQLFNNKLKLFDEKNGLNKLKSHFFLTGGYNYEINRDFQVEPSMILKGSFPRALQLDINTRVIYQEMAWLGLSFRSQDALSLLLGYNHEKKIYVGYSYDFTVTDLRKYNSGTHEIMIGYRFNDVR